MNQINSQSLELLTKVARIEEVVEGVEGVKWETKTNLDASRSIGYLGIMNLEKLSLTKTSSSGDWTHFLVESFINNKHNWELGIEIEAAQKKREKKAEHLAWGDEWNEKQ